MRRGSKAAAAVVALCLATTACTSSVVSPGETGTPVSTTAPAPDSSTASASAPRSSPRASARPGSSSPGPSPSRHSEAPPSAQSPTASPTRSGSAQRLPLDASPGTAGQVITVTAPSTSSTTATLQAWTKVSGGWRRSGPTVLAHLGTDGMTAHASETKSATPIGSFTLTRAFGHDSNPGTALPYTQTTPDDWWISQPGELYNTFQDCSADCGFTQGDPNEHLYYETPFYDYAVVIDYNTANAPGGIKPGKGSAFFLHVTDGNPTAGCVSIPMDQLVRIMRWLIPARHPRIMIGIG